MARTSNLANVATVSRATKAWYPGGWDFTNGGAITGDFVEYANNVARDGAQGLLVEESSTNEIRNPRGEGAVAGTPGTLPTNWTSTDYSTTREIVGSGTENGWPYVDVRWSGTPTADPRLLFDTATAVTASNGQTWSYAVGIKVVGGDFTNITNLRLTSLLYDGGAFSSNGSFDTFDTADSTHRRFFADHTISDANADSIIFALDVNWDGSGAIDITLRIYAPQLEEKAYPTSPILPPASSPAASDRDADDIEVANGAWSNDNGPGTLYVDAVLNNGGAASNFGTIGASYGEDVSVDYIRFRAAGTTNFNVVAEDDNSVVVSTVSTTSLTGAGQSVRAAIAWNTDDIAASVNGETQGTDNSASIGFGAAKIIMASGAANTTFPSQYVRNVRYWPRRLTNAELEALVGN